MIEPGTHRFGPSNATLAVRTRRGGAAAKAGHDLLLHVTAWEGTLTIGADGAPTAAELAADATSLRVQEGTGGMKALDEDDKSNIHKTIDDEVLQRRDIAFSSTAVDGGWADGAWSAGEGYKTVEDVALYAHGTGALPPGVEGGLDAQTVYRD